MYNLDKDKGFCFSLFHIVVLCSAMMEIYGRFFLNLVMAIFFPLFTLLEDLGYLPRVAFNLDRYFKKCSACGKQSLTMCMGLIILL